MADKIEQVYNAYKADGATKAASLQQFKNWMYGDNYRRGIYNDLKKQGANVGTFEHFSQALGYRAKSNVAKAASNYVAPQKGYTVDTSDYDPIVPNSIARVTEEDRRGVLDSTYLQRLNNKRTRKVQGSVGIDNQTGAQQSVGFDKKKRLKITRDDYKPLYRSKGKGFNPAIMTDLGNGVVADYSADDETGSTLSLPRTDVKLSDDVNRAAEELNKQIVEETAKKIDAKNAEAWRNELKGSQIGSAAGGDLMGLSIIKEANQKYGSSASSKEVLQQIAKGYVSDKAKQLVAKKAEQLGVEPDALWKQMLYGMGKTVRDRYVDLEMPKTDFEYAMRGISNSIIGSMGKRMAMGAGDRDIISEGEQKYADQVEKRANEQGLWSGASAAKYGNIATGMATDALAFAGAGKAAGATMNALGKGLNLITKTPLGKSLLGRVVGTSASELTKKYGAEGAARILNFVGSNKSLMGTLLTDGAKGTLQSGLTLGNYGIMQYATVEGYDKLAKGEDGWWSGLVDNYGEQFKTGLKFGAVGAVGGAVGRGVGITGTEASMLQKVKHGLTKATVSTGAFVAESLAFRSEQMADEWARENKINFVDNLVQGACENLTIKLSGGHFGQFKPRNIIRGMLMNGKDSRIVLNDAEKKEFLSNTNAKSFQAACEALNPDHRTKAELNGDKKTPLSGHDADGNPVSKMAKFLEDTNISLRTRQKVAAALGGVVSKSVPRAAMIAVTPIEKGKYAVKAYSKDKELLSVDEFSNKEKAEAKKQEIIDRRDDRDFKNKYLGAMNNLSQEDGKWILEKAVEDLGFSSVAEWNLTRALDKSNKEENDKKYNEAIKKRMAERKGMRAKTVLDIQREVNEKYGVDLDKVMGKDPTLRKASERAAVEEFSKRLDEVVVDKNDAEQQAEMASQSGAEIAEQADINNSEEFTEASKQVNDRLNAATEAWMEIVKNNPDIEDYMKHNPDTDILEMRELFGDEVADAYLELSNAQAAKDGFINQTGQKIEGEVQSQVTQSIFQGKINGEEDKENVYLLTTENGQSWTLVGGDVEIDEDGSVKVKEDGGVAIVRDENGNTVQLANLEGLKAQRIPIKEYENTIRTTLQEQKTQEIQASEGQLPAGNQPETPQVPKQPNRPTESEPSGDGDGKNKGPVYKVDYSHPEKSIHIEKESAGKKLVLGENNGGWKSAKGVWKEPDGWGEKKGLYYYKFTIPDGLKKGDTIVYWFKDKPSEEQKKNIARLITYGRGKQITREVLDILSGNKLDRDTKELLDFLERRHESVLSSLPVTEDDINRIATGEKKSKRDLAIQYLKGYNMSADAYFAYLDIYRNTGDNRASLEFEGKPLPSTNDKEELNKEEPSSLNRRVYISTSGDYRGARIVYGDKSCPWFFSIPSEPRLYMARDKNGYYTSDGYDLLVFSVDKNGVNYHSRHGATSAILWRKPTFAEVNEIYKRYYDLPSDYTYEDIAKIIDDVMHTPDSILKGEGDNPPKPNEDNPPSDDNPSKGSEPPSGNEPKGNEPSGNEPSNGENPSSGNNPPTNNEPLPSGDKPEGGNKPAGNNESETMKFRDGTDVPMTEEGEPDFGKMTPEHGAELYKDTFGDDAEKMVDDEVKAAEKELKNAEKMKVGGKSWSEKTASKKAKDAAIEAAKTKLERANAIKKVLTAQAVAEGMGDNGAGEAEQGGDTNERTARAKQRFDSAPKVKGRHGSITLPNGEEIEGTYYVVSADGLTPTHDPFNHFGKHPDAPVDQEGRTLNDRDYEHDGEAQNTVLKHGGEYNGLAVDNVPVVLSNGLVVSGNERTMAGQIAAKNGTDKAYKDKLRKNAEGYGIKPEELDGIKNGRLVFVPDKDMPYTTETFRKFNKPTEKKQGGTETAIANSKTLKPEEVGAIISEIDGSGSLEAFFNNPKATTDLFKTLVEKGVIGQNEIAGYVDDQGKISVEGKELVKNLLIGAVFKPETIRMMGNDSALKTKVVSGIRAITENMKLGEYNLKEEIDEAVKLLAEARSHNMKVDELLRQQDAFGENASEKYSNMAQAIAQALEGSTTLFRDLVREYNDIASQRNTGEGNLFGEAQSKEDFVKEFVESSRILKENSLKTYGTEERHQEGEGGNNVPSNAKPAKEGEGKEPTGAAQPAAGRGVKKNEQPEHTAGEESPTHEETGKTGTKEKTEREKYIEEHPMTEEQIDATDAPEARKEAAKSYLRGEDESGLAKASYRSVFNKIKSNKPDEPIEPPASGGGASEEQPKGETASKPSKPKGKSKPKPKEGEKPKGEKGKNLKDTASGARQEKLNKMKEIEARLKAAKGKGKKDDSPFDFYNVEALTDEQNDIMLEYIEAGADLSYELLKDGTVKSKEEFKKFLNENLADGLKDATGYSDKDVDDLFEDLWNWRYKDPETKETKLISDWAKDFGVTENEPKNNENNGKEEGNKVDTGNVVVEKPKGSVSEPGGAGNGGGTVESANGRGSAGTDSGTSRNGNGGHNRPSARHTPNERGGENNGTLQGGAKFGQRGAELPHDGGGSKGANSTGKAGDVLPDVGRNALASIEQEKVPYQSPSDPENKHAIGSVIPSGIASSVKKAFDKLVKEVKKNVTDFVRDELGYSSDEEMFEGLSSEQVDSVALAIHSMKKGKSFIIGDQTGVGKGRQAASLIRWAKKNGKKVIFVTESSKLFSDMYGDIQDIGSEYMPFTINNDTEANITDRTGKVAVRHPNGQTLNALFQSGSYELPTDKNGKQYDLLMMTYSQGSVTNKEKLEWIRQYAKDAVVIMDESHNASGASTRGQFFSEIIDNAAGVTFLSATYAKRPDNMAIYAQRSSLADVNMPRKALIEAIQQYGVPMQEILADGLFGSGEMIRRERDMTGVKTKWLKPEEMYDKASLEKARRTSDKTMEIVNNIINFQRAFVAPIVAEHEKEVAQQNKMAAKMGAPTIHYDSTPYSSQVSNIVNLMVYGLKAKKAAEMAIEQIKEGKKPVIAVENTMGSYVNEIEGSVPDAGFGRIFEKGIKFSLRYAMSQSVMNESTGQYKKDKSTEQVFDAYEELPDAGRRALDMIRQQIEAYLGDTYIEQLSLSPIDMVKNMIAEAGYNCGEITGRTKQLVKNEDGSYSATSLSIKKKDAASRFNGGSAEATLPQNEQYDALVLNVAGATGISLHASAKFGNTKPRTMIILQPSRDVNTEVQMRGRIDRTGQLHRGEYYYLTSPIPAEQKSIMMLKQKLASLDANSVGTEEVSSNRVEAEDMDNKYGNEAAKELLLDHLNDINNQLENGQCLTFNNKTREWEAPDNLLYGLLKGIQRLDCETQEFVINELATRYKDKIDYLNQNGINDLKSTTMNLEAVTDVSETFIKGKDESSPNIFAHDTKIERVEANVLKKPLRSSDMQSRMKKYGVYDENGKLDVTHPDKIDQSLAEYKRAKLAERQQKLDAALDTLIEKQKKIYPKNEAETDEEYEARIQQLPAVKEMKQKNENTINQFRTDLGKQAAVVSKAGTYLKPGMPCFVPLTDALDNGAAMSYGRFLGFEKGKDGNPRSYKAVFAVKDSRAVISIPCVNSEKVIAKIIENSRDMELRNITKNEATNDYYSWYEPEYQKAVDAWWDAKIPKNTNRQHRYMITGNILQACGSLGKYKGQIVTFTRRNPETGEITLERGMLLAENFDPENFKVRTQVTKEDVWNSHNEIKDDVSKISVSRQGNTLVVTFKKQGSQKLADHPVFQDAELVGIALKAADGTAYSKGKTSVSMSFAEKNAEKALELLYKNHSFTKEKYFVMPDSKDKPDCIVRTGKPAEEVIKDLKGKYGNSLWRVEDEINRMLKRYRMDVNNEELKAKITEAVQLRQAYYRERYANKPTSRLGWKALIFEQRMEQASRQMANAETDEQMRDIKEDRQRCYNIREAILEEIESRGEAKGTSLHLEQGQWTAKDAKGLFDKLNTDEENQRIMDKVFEKVKDLGMQVVLDEKIDASIGGRAAGNVIEYNWKYLNAEYLPDQAKANTILHEMIHTVTAYADHLVEQGMEHMLKPEMVEAINDLHSILDAVKDQEVFKHDGVKQYGLTNVREMLAEAGSNESFRADLKKAGLWARMLDGILRFFGFERSGAKKANAYDSVMTRLEGLIEGFDEGAWRKTYAGTVYGGYSEKRTDVQPSGDVRYRKVYVFMKEGKTKEGKQIWGGLKALKFGEELNTDIKIEHFASDVENPEVRAALERGENVKGWYDIKTGEVHLYLPNITDKYDAQKTVAHEVIGHKGMRGLLGEDGYKDMMRRMYTHMSDADVSEVNRRMMQNGWDFYTAMDEYVADKAEDTVWNPEAASLWENVRHYVTEAIQKVGYRITPSVNDVKYWLWESKRGLKGGDAYTEMKRSSLLWELNNTKTSLEDMISEDYEANETHSSEKEEAIRYRKDTLDPQKDDTPLQSGTKTAIETELASKGSKRIECWVDDKHGLKVVQQHLGKGITGGIDASIDPYHGAIAQSSIVREKQSHFQNAEMKKMNEEIRKCTLALGGGKQAYEDLNIYAYVKSGLERNRVLFVRDVAGKVDRQVEKINKKIAKADPNMSRLAVKGVEEYRDTFHTMKSQLDAQLRAGKIDMRQYCDKMDGFITNYRFNYDGVAEHDQYIDKLNEWYDKNVAQKYDPDTNDYSGIMSIEQFQVNGGSPNDALIDHVMQTENTIGKESADKLWDAVNGVTSLSLKNSYEYQNIDKAAYERASNMFSFYLPMRRWKADTMEDSYAYMRAGFGNKGGSELKHAKGRTTLASSPFGTACSLAMNSIARGEDNRNKQRLYRLAYRWVKEHTTTDDEGNSRLTEEAPVMISEVWYEKRTDPVTGDEYWEAVSPDIKPDDSAAEIQNKVEQFQTTMEAAEKLGNAKRTAQNGVYDKHFDVNAHKNEHIVYVNIGGRQKMIIFPGNPRAAQAINGDLKSDKGTGKLMRGMAAMFTSYNMTFSITNTSRDTVFANNNVAVRESPKYWLKFTNNQRMLLGGMARGMVALNTPKLRGAYYEMWNRYKNGEAPQNEREIYFKEFMENGGKTGFVETKTIKDLENAIRKNATESKVFGISAKDIFKAVPDIIEAMNERAENLNRFAAYLTSRQMGRSIMRSVQDAKEVSTNFNRKGAGSAAYRGDNNATRAEKFQGWLHDHAKSCYLFFNAGMQSLALLSYNIKHHPVRTAAYTVAIPMLFANAIVPMVNAWFASVYGEDDDDVYSNLPEWDRRNNLCLYKGKGQWVKIPLPIEIRAFYGLGDCALGMINKNYESTKTPAIDVLSQLTQALPLDFMGEGGDAIGAMLPDVMKPGYHIVSNKDWTGKPLYKRSPWNTYEPEWQKQFKGEADWEVEASKWLNEMTGGGDHVKGWADGMWTTNPAVWDEIVSGYLGGAGSDAGRFVKLGSRAATGNWEDFSVREIPMVRALYSTPTERTQYYRVTNKYAKYKEQSKEYEHNLKAWGKSDDPLEKAHFIRDTHEQVPELRQLFEINKAEVKLKAQLNIANNENMSDDVRKKAQMKAYQIKQDVVNKIESGL